MKKLFLTLTMLLFAFTGVMRASAEQGNVRADQVIEQGFEDGLGDWTMNHCHSSSGPTSTYGGNTGNYAFRFYYTANYPQYLISPELDDNDGVNFTFYAARYSSSYPETFMVGYSSTTNDPTEFTWGSEVTCTTMYGAGTYEEYSYDFPAGTKYVSIACTSNDQFYLLVDDITVTATEPAPAPTPGEAVEVTIGDGTGTTYYFPIDNYFNYSCTEQVYLAEEIGIAGTINSISFYYNYGTAYTASNVTMYMKHVSRTGFASTLDCEPLEPGDVVWTGAIAPTEAGWYTFTLDTPFEYNGTDNLLVAFFDGTSGYPGTSYTWRQTATSTYMGWRSYSDSSVVDPYDLAAFVGSKSVYEYRLNVQLNITTSGDEPKAFATVPAVLDLGYRPNGAWMAPYVFNLKSNVGAVTVNALDFSGNYFTADAELPATVSGNNPLEVAVSTGTAEAGEVNSTITILYSGNDRDAEQLNIKATAYNPVDGDVYENAVNVTSFPYAGNAPAGIYKNYELPVATEGADAVYKMTFANDVMLTAGTTGADGVAALYTEDFAGEGGPMADNYYVYEGPTVNPGPTNLWFSYAYTGSNTWYGTSAGGGFYFGYKISTDVIAAENLAGLTITTVEAAAREAYPYYCYIIEGGATPFDGDLIGMGGIENPEALYFFDINLEEPVYISGDSDIWVIFYSDSPYAGYCGRYPVDVTNGKIWTYNPNATSPQWTSNTTYTPVIYCHMLELPTGRTATMDLAKMEVKKGNGVNSEIAEAEGNVTNTSKALLAMNKRGNRDTDPQIADMFVPAGTYYLAVASTDAEFPVSIATAEVPAPEQAVIISPLDGATYVEAPYFAEWILGDYTAEMQVLVGTQYPPQTALIEWTDYLVESAFITDLEPNQSYFMQVNERNSAGTTYGEIIAFTTPIDPVEGFAVENDSLYPGDAAEFTWEANRSFKGYNLYMDGVKVNESLITTNAYAVEGLEYNMLGYDFQVSAVYDAGESVLSDPITVYMTGTGTISGHVYDAPNGYDPEDPDQSHPVANLPVIIIVSDEYQQVQEYEVFTDEEGFYTAEVLAGMSIPGISQETAQAYGYAVATSIQMIVNVAYEGVYEGIDIYTHEYYYPLQQITATENEEENNVLVEWSWNPAEMIVDFETGDFSQADFTLPATYPWAITESNVYEGQYAMKSTCEGQGGASSIIEATVDVPYDGKMGFWVKVSSEANYDLFTFYIDGVAQGSAMSGNLNYQYKEYSVTEGTHTYKWVYTKDTSVNSNDDCVYVDAITMYRLVEPTPPPAPGDVVVKLTAPDIWGDGSGYQMLLDDTHSLYGTVIPESGALSTNCSGNEGIYDQFTYKIPTNADGNCSTSNIVLNSTVEITIPSGIYDWCITNPTPGDRIWIAAANGNVGGRYDDYVFEGGHTYEFTVSKYGSNDGVDVTITGGKAMNQPKMNFNNTDVKVADPVMLANRVETPIQTRGNRSFMSYNLYRRNNYDAASVANPELIAEGLTADVMQYVDNAWNTISFGEYQWGIQATYEGYAPVPERNREVYTYTFDSGLEGWTNIDADADGNVWFNSSESQTYSCYSYATYGHNATGCFMVSQSYTDCTYDSYDADNFLVSPQKYPIDANSSITFWQDWANDSYPDYYEVMVSTAANPGASDFTTVWSVGSKSHGNGAKIRNINNRYENWTEYTVSLAAYAGQEVWIAFRHQDYDNYELWLDDVTITAGGSSPVPPTPAGNGLSEILWSNVIEKDMEATLTFNITLNNGQSPAGAIIEIVGDETYTEEVEDATTEIVVRKAPAYDITVTLPGYAPAPWTYSGAIEADQTFDINFEEQILPVDGLYVSPTGWATWDGTGGGVTPTPPTPGEGEWYYYDNGVNEDGIGTNGGNFWWAVMFPAGSYEGNAVTKVSTYDYMAMTGNVTIYNDGTTAPATAVGTADVTLTGSEDFVEVEFAEPVTIDPSKNLWIVYYNGSGATYPAAVCDNTGDANGRWVSLDGTSWEDLAIYSLDYTFMIRAYVATSNRGEVVEISAPQGKGSNGTFANAGIAKRSDRAPIKYIVKLDGVIEGETNFIGFQHNVAGMEEGSEHTTAVRPVYISGDNGPWMEYTWTYTSCDHFAGVTELAAAQQGTDVKLTWTMPDAPGPTPPPTPPTGDVVVKLTVGDVWGDGSGYQMLLDDTHSLYGTVIPATGALSTNCSGNEGIYNQFSHKIPENADGNCSTSNIVLNSTVEITIPAGTYDWCITNPTPGDRIWIAAANGNVGGRYDDYVFEAGHTYEFTVSMFGSNDGVNVTITGGKAMAQPKMMLANIDVRVADAAHTTQRGGTLGTAGVGFGAANNALTDDGNWYYYDDGVNEDAIGTGGGNFWWGIMLPAGSYEGNSLTKVAAYDYMAMTGTASIYQGGTTAPEGTALGSVNVTFTGSADFVEFEFAEPVELDPEQNVWVVFYNASGATYPAAVCANTGDVNGRWVSLDGSTWEDMASYSLDHTFMVRAYIESSGPAPVPVEEGILGAMIFMDDEPIAFVPGTPNEYVVAGTGSIDATYAVRVVYDGALDTTYYAMSCPVEVEYVAPPTSVEELSANTVIYPNPTHDNVTIEAKGMRRITVVSALGQVVYDAEIKADMTQMNLGQFKAGVYMVRIATENGTVVKRVTVVK